MRKLSSLVPVAALLTTLIACSSDGDENQDVVASNAFVGSWTSGCYAFQNGDLTEYYLDDFQLQSDLSYTGLFQQYSEADCSSTVVRSEAYTGTYSLGNEVVTSDGVTATELDITGIYIDELIMVLTLVYRSGDVLYLGLNDGTTAVGERRSTINFDRPHTLR